MVNSHQTTARKPRLPLPNENDPHQTFANRDPQRMARVVTRFLTGRPSPAAAPHTNMINRQGVASRSDQSSNDDERVPDPSILTPPARQSRDLQGATKLECRFERLPRSTRALSKQALPAVQVAGPDGPATVVDVVSAEETSFIESLHER
jgi:hypothetical protein